MRMLDLQPAFCISSGMPATHPTLDQLRRALAIGEHIGKLQTELSSIFHGIAQSNASTKFLKMVGVMGPRKKRTMSKSARAKIAEAQRARWAQLKKGRTAKPMAQTEKPAGKKKKGKMSAAGRANIIAAQKKRWAKVKRENAAKHKSGEQK